MPAAKARRGQSATGDTNFSNVVQTLDRAWSIAPFPGASSKVCGDLDAAVRGAALPRAAKNSTGGRGRGTASQATVAIITLGGGGTIDRPAERQKPGFRFPRHAGGRSMRFGACGGVEASSPGGAMNGYNAGSRKLRPDQRRVAPHCKVVNLVRSGRKQPQRFSASAGGTARHPT